MNIKNNIKPRLTFKEIGAFRFFLGLLVSIPIYILLYQAMLGIKEALILFSFDYGLLIFDNAENYKLNFIFSGLSFVFTLSISLRFWIHKLPYGNFHRRVRIKRSINNLLFNSWAPMATFLRLSSLYGLWLLMYSYFLYFELIRNYEYAFYLFILVYFFMQWNEIRLIYRCRKWLYYSLCLLIFSSVLISHYNPYRNDLMVKFYHKLNHYKKEYINTEIDRAESWGIKFTKNERETLNYKKSIAHKYWKDKIKKQLEDPQLKWDAQTLIIHKIFIHNLYYRPHYYSNRNAVFLKLDSLMNSFKHFDLVKDRLQIQLTFEILNEYKKVLFPKMDFTDAEFKALTIHDKIYYSDIYFFNQRGPENWKFTHRNVYEVLEIKPPEIDTTNAVYVDLGTIQAEEDIYFEEYNRKWFLENLIKIINELKVNPKYKDHVNIIEN